MTMTVATATVSAEAMTPTAAADWSRPEPGVASDLLPDPGFFEGAEKLLELAFDGGAAVPAAGLRRVTRAQWAELLKLVRCEIVSATSNDAMDSYVLSESSLFVFPRKIILKTCGTTTLLHALEGLLAHARACGLDEVVHVSYSRKNFLKPDRQLHPHGSFDHETAVLSATFPHGRAHILGSIKDDHWCLYLAESPRKAACPRPLSAPDHTLEILMHELSPEAMRPFYRGPHFVSSQHTSKVSGIADLVPGMTLDELVFNPCGYSANGILDDSYFTIHVTPQPYCSFASFETNLPLEQYTALIAQVVAIFQPRRFQVTLFASEESEWGRSSERYDPAKVVGFRRTEMQFHQFEQYNLTFAEFVRAL